MGAQQSLTAGYAYVSGDLPEVDKQHSGARPSLQKQGARENGKTTLLRVTSSYAVCRT